MAIPIVQGAYKLSEDFAKPFPPTMVHAFPAR